jgi:hypothetical protein
LTRQICRTERGLAGHRGATISPVVLGGTVELKDCFNARSNDAARILMVVSPTCPDCLRGVSVVTAAASEVEATNVRLLALWTAMRPGDCEAAAEKASAAFESAPDFSHFWEEDGWPISTALRPLLGLGGFEPTRSAWDVYLFYAPGVTWVGPGPPTPTDWAHQLQPDPGIGDRLTRVTVAHWLDGRP